MAYTQLSDVFNPEVFESYQVEDPVEKTALFQSGAVTTNAFMQNLANNEGFITTIPFWRPLDASVEPNYDNDVYADIAEPQKVETDEQIARIAHLNEGFSSMGLVAAITKTDPMKYVAEHIDAFWAKQFQRRVIATLVGLYNDNVAGNSGDMVINISNPDVASVTDAMRISADAVVDASMTMGDALSGITGIAMHSVIFGRLLKQQLIEYIPDAQGKMTIPTYLGKTVTVDDGLPVLPGTGTNPKLQYITILFGAGIIGYGEGTVPVPSEYEREAARGNGGGVETLWSRKRWMVHPFGYKFTSTTITGPGKSPTWADLRLATNWERVVQSRKSIPLAFLVTNA